MLRIVWVLGEKFATNANHSIIAVCTGIGRRTLLMLPTNYLTTTDNDHSVVLRHRIRSWTNELTRIVLISIDLVVLLVNLDRLLQNICIN